MLTEGSVKDGRIIVFLERTGPAGTGSSSGGVLDPGAASDEAVLEAGAGGTPAAGAPGGEAGPEGSGDASGPAAKAAGKTSGKAAAARAKATLRTLLESSAAAAAKNQAETMIAAAEAGAPFCEDCAEHQRLLEEQRRG